MTTYTPELDKLIGIAVGQIGYHEGRSNGHWNNIEKYAAQVPGLSWANGQPWCDVFVAWCFKQAGLLDLIPVSASVAASEAEWKKRGRWSEYPAIGAQVIFGNGEHTGTAIAFDANEVVTVEGNTNNNGSAEGDGVYKKIHQRRDPWVTGYGVPKFSQGVISADPKFANERPKAAPAAKSRGKGVDTEIAHLDALAKHNTRWPDRHAHILAARAALLEIPAK